MRSIAPILSVLVLAACGGPTEPAPNLPKSAPATATVADLGWLDGMWRTPAAIQRWLHVSGALYNVQLADAGFEVDVIDDSDDDGAAAPLALTTYPDGRDPVQFKLVASTPGVLELADGARVMRLSKADPGLRVELDDPPRQPVVIALQGDVIPPAPELEAADREFAIATARDGADAWAKIVRADGAIWRGKRIEGPDAIREAMTKTLANNVLAWRPVTSGKRGAWGFTLGTYELGPRRGPTQSHGSYCTIWGQSPEGWKVVFDIGHPASDE